LNREEAAARNLRRGRRPRERPCHWIGEGYFGAHRTTGPLGQPGGASVAERKEGAAVMSRGIVDPGKTLERKKPRRGSTCEGC